MARQGGFFGRGGSGGALYDVMPVSERTIRVAAVNRESLKKWWGEVVAQKGKYKCYAVFLYLPTDDSAQFYLDSKAFMQELDLISGKNCLVLATSKEYVRRFGIDQEPVHPCALYKAQPAGETDDSVPSEETYTVLHRRASTEARRKKPLGYCNMFARMFNLTYDQFPCMLLFQDLDSRRHIVVSLQGIDAKKIALRMRNIFTVVGNAIAGQRDPLKEVRGYLLKYKIMDKKTKVVNDVVEFAGRTMGFAMQAWINSLFK